MEFAGSTPNADALKSRSGPKRQPRVNLDGPGGEPYQNKKEVLMAQHFLTNQIGGVSGNQQNPKSFEAKDIVKYTTPNGDTQFVGQGLRPVIAPPVPVMAMHLHPDFDGGKLDTDSFSSTVGVGAGPAPGDAESYAIPQQATFGMRGGNGRMKGKSLASSGKAKGTKFGLGPAGSGPQRNVSA